ncbi:MAG: BamA/TamA family outer membrane protein [Bacteroidota bacterium]
MSTIYKQVPNSGLFKSGLWWYYRVDEPGDTTKFDRWVKKVLAEPPAIYDKSLAEATAISMKYFMQHKGYKDVIVKDSAITKRKKTKVVYLIEPNELYVIDTVIFNCKDSVVRLILNDLRGESHLGRGKPVSSELFEKEATRITEALQNRGYAYFAQNYIKPKGLPDGNRVKVIYDILTPPENNRHQTYRIGKIFVDPYYTQQGLLTRKRDTIIVDGVHFMQGSVAQIKPQNILKSIFFRPGDLYEESNFKKSNRQLGALEIIKYVSMSPRESPDSIGVLDFEILLSPKKRMTLGGDFEFNNSTYNSVNTNLLGTSVSLNFRNRNVFKNAAVFNARAEVGFELNISPNDNLLYSRNITLQSDLYFPRFVDPLGFWRLTKKTRFLRSAFYNDLRDKAKTRLSASFENISLFDFYEYNSFNGTFGYELQRDRNNRFILNQTGINMLLVDIKQDFAPIIDSNPFLQESFSDQLFTGFLFRDFSYIHTGKRNTLGVSWFFRGDFELSGAEIWLANSIRNAIADTPTTFQLFNSVDFAQYFRVEIDVRRFKQYSSGKHSWAFRFNTAIAVPYGFSSEVPYVKQYFLGGPNSVRAWRIRELGPGSFLDPNTIPPADTIPFYQAANYKIEFNLEYRRDIIKFWGTTIEGAIFLDGGNIWTLREDSSRPGSQLLWSAKPNPEEPNETIGDNFLRQIALGSGVGIRLDFNYFILRLDMALKLRNNFRDSETNSYWVDRNWRKLQLRDFNYNLAVGYPF